MVPSGAEENVPFGPRIDGVPGVMETIALNHKPAGASFPIFHGKTTAMEQRAINAEGPGALSTALIDASGAGSLCDCV